MFFLCPTDDKKKKSNMLVPESKAKFWAQILTLPLSGAKYKRKSIFKNLLMCLFHVLGIDSMATSIHAC